MGLTLRGSNPSRGKGFFCTPKRPDRLSGPPSFLFNGYQVFLGVKRPGRDAKHLPPYSVGVKNGWIYTSVPSIYLQALERENYTFFNV